MAGVGAATDINPATAGERNLLTSKSPRPRERRCGAADEIERDL